MILGIELDDIKKDKLIILYVSVLSTEHIGNTKL